MECYPNALMDDCPFHPTYNKPYVLRIPYLEKEINDLFNLRSEVLF